MTELQTLSLKEYIDSKIRKENKFKNDPLVNSMYIIMVRLPGHNLDDILDMYITQFYVLLDMTAYIIEEERKATKKKR